MNTINYITDESVTLYVKAIINNRESNDFACKAANEAVSTGSSLPEEFEIRRARLRVICPLT
jgi:hypothetical protein